MCLGFVLAVWPLAYLIGDYFHRHLVRSPIPNQDSAYTPGFFPFALNEERALPIIKKALELGINFFDTVKWIFSLEIAKKFLDGHLKGLCKP